MKSLYLYSCWPGAKPEVSLTLSAEVSSAYTLGLYLHHCNPWLVTLASVFDTLATPSCLEGPFWCCCKEPEKSFQGG